MAIPKIRVPIEDIGSAILVMRGQKVFLDDKLTALYGVSTARLNQQVRRNRERFSADFVFELTRNECDTLMLQIATSMPGRGGRRKLSPTFTEHGAIMALTVLYSPRAAQMSIYDALTLACYPCVRSSKSQAGLGRMRRATKTPMIGTLTGITSRSRRSQHLKCLPVVSTSSKSTRPCRSGSEFNAATSTSSKA